jgi:hypothetical protein
MDVSRTEEDEIGGSSENSVMGSVMRGMLDEGTARQRSSLYAIRCELILLLHSAKGKTRYDVSISLLLFQRKESKEPLDKDGQGRLTGL